MRVGILIVGCLGALATAIAVTFVREETPLAYVANNPAYSQQVIEMDGQTMVLSNGYSVAMVSYVCDYGSGLVSLSPEGSFYNVAPIRGLTRISIEAIYPVSLLTGLATRGIIPLPQATRTYLLFSPRTIRIILRSRRY